MAKIKLEDSGEKIFKLAGKTFLKGQYVVEYTETNTDSNGVLTSPEKATVFLRPIAFSQIDRQSSLPFKSPIAWTEFLDSNGDAYADFDTFSEALATAIANFNSGGATPQYKVYSALISQSGTSAPTAIVLENTLGATIAWSFVSTGNYRATASSAIFTADKCGASVALNFSGTPTSFVFSTSQAVLNSYDTLYASANGKFFKTFFEIRVYS